MPRDDRGATRPVRPPGAGRAQSSAQIPNLLGGLGKQGVDISNTVSVSVSDMLAIAIILAKASDDESS
jgi:hypothetical protein